MAIQVITGFMSNSSEHLDVRRGPYVDFNDVDARLPVIARRTGLQIDIDNGSDIVTYRFEGGTAVANLVVNDPSVGGGTTWGSITGTLASQTDLQGELDAKFDKTGGALTGDIILKTLANSTIDFIGLNDDANIATIASRYDLNGKLLTLRVYEDVSNTIVNALEITDTADVMTLNAKQIAFAADAMLSNMGGNIPYLGAAPDLSGVTNSGFVLIQPAIDGPLPNGMIWLQTLKYSDGAGYSQLAMNYVGTPTLYARNKVGSDPWNAWVDLGGGGGGSYLPLAGGIMTGDITMGVNSITFKDTGYTFESKCVGNAFVIERDGTQYMLIDTAGTHGNRLTLDYNGNFSVGTGTINGAAITASGAATEFLNGTGVYSTPAKDANINGNSISTTTNLGTTLSRAELDNLIPSPIQGELYGIQDNNNHSFLVIYDGTDFWYERFAKAN